MFPYRYFFVFFSQGDFFFTKIRSSTCFHDKIKNMIAFFRDFAEKSVFYEWIYAWES